MMIVRVFIVGLWALASTPALGQAACDGPAPVCAIKDRVYAIASSDPAASAVLIEPGLLVTNRHAVANNPRAQVFRPDGSELLADVVPTAYAGDLVLLSAPGLTGSGAWKPAPEPRPDTDLFTVANDVGRGRIRVYPPGRLLSPPAAGKPLARLHHTARSQPGNSGGALVDAEGRLVAIVTSGGSGRFEAIPATEIARLRALSGPDHAEANRRIGLAYRQCTEAIDQAAASRQAMRAPHIAFIAERCRTSNNRQLLDLAGQTLGRRGHHADAIAMFAAALDQDPGALNARLGLVVTLHLAQRYQDELAHLRRLIAVLPRDLQVLRFAIQAGTWAGDKALAREGLTLMKTHHPKLAPLAERFMNAPPPTTPRRSSAPAQ